MAKSKPVRITERMADALAGSRVNRESRTITGVSLCGLQSRNGYRYTEGCLKGATAKYVKRAVFLDHSDDPMERSVRDIAALVHNPRFERGRLRGDLYCLVNEAGNTLLALAEASPTEFGMSHCVEARRSDDGATVEEIIDVVSVDAVFRPATTGGIFEGSNPMSSQTTVKPRSGTAASDSSYLTGYEAALPADHPNSTGGPGDDDSLRAQIQAILDKPGEPDGAKVRAIRELIDAEPVDASDEYAEAARDIFPGRRGGDRGLLDILRG